MKSGISAEIYLEKLYRHFSEGGKSHAVLNGLEGCFLKGESVAIRGRSGSGKSTLLNLIGGIDQPDSGRVTVCGTELTALSERDRTLFRRQHIGFVYQAFNLINTLTVADNLRLVLELNSIGRHQTEQRIDVLLTQVGLADRADSLPDRLSGGEQQRVAIARAVSHRPRILLADEPTGNLDDDSAEGILELLHDLQKDAGCTLLIATHSERVTRSCDRALQLVRGQLAPFQP